MEYDPPPGRPKRKESEPRPAANQIRRAPLAVMENVKTYINIACLGPGPAPTKFAGRPGPAPAYLGPGRVLAGQKNYGRAKKRTGFKVIFVAGKKKI